MSVIRVVIIGGVALGPKTACRLNRLEPECDVTIIDQDQYISYGGRGIPYFISGDISDVDELMSTSFHKERTPEFFSDAKDGCFWSAVRGPGPVRRRGPLPGLESSIRKT